MAGGNAAWLVAEGKAKAAQRTAEATRDKADQDAEVQYHKAVSNLLAPPKTSK